MLHYSPTSTYILNLFQGLRRLTTRFYPDYTPAWLHRPSLKILELFWRGCGKIATHSHIWWSCPVLRAFWLSVLHWIEDIQGDPIPSDPWGRVVPLHRRTNRPMSALYHTRPSECCLISYS